MRNVRTEADFARFAREELEQILRVSDAKGKEYGANRPALSNFEEGAAILDETPELYLLNLATKQFYVIIQWARGLRPLCSFDSLQERSTDLIVYLLLLKFMLLSRQLDGEPTGDDEPSPF
jgi:hypothetical protein